MSGGKKCGCEPCPPGAPLWMATFADMATLLLAFFVMLLSFSSIQESKFHTAVRSLQGAFGVLQNPPTVIAQPEVPVPRAHEKELEEIIYAVEEVARILNEQGLEDIVTMVVKKDGITIRISTPFLFHSARAELREESFFVLDRIAQALERIPQQVRIEGHTDNLPINTAEFPSNWELSGARSLSVLRYFTGKNLPPERLSAVSFGEHQPVADNADPDGRQRNRRVEIFVEMPDSVGQDLLKRLVPDEERR